MYQNLTQDLLHSTESQIVETYLGVKPEKGNELTTEISMYVQFYWTQDRNF